jgi:hypothetical protein
MRAVSLEDPQSLNLYSYCGNDPINYVDPDGLFLKKLFGWIGRALKTVFKVFAVVLAVAAVLAVSWGFGAIALKAAIGAGIFALMGWGSDKLARLAAGIAFPGGGYGGFRTPSTFPNGTGVSSINDFLAQQRGRAKSPPPKIEWINWVIKEPRELYNLALYGRLRPEKDDKGRVQCALLPQRWTTRKGGQSWEMGRWKEGASLSTRPRLDEGTVLATFKNGKYTGSDESHVAIFMGYAPEGVVVVDQYMRRGGGYHVGLRVIPFDDSQPYYNNANRLSVVQVPVEVSSASGKSPGGCD